MSAFRLTLLATIFSASLFGSGVTIKLSGNQDPACTAPEICITNDTFDISTDLSGGGYFQANNQLGGNITVLNFDLPYTDAGCPNGAPTPVTLTLDTTFLAFATTSLSVNSSSACAGAGVADYLLSLDFTPGIPESVLFDIDLNNDGSTNPDGTGGWLPSTTSSVNTTLSPEPATLGFAGAGLLMLGAAGWRKRRSVTARVCETPGR